ncbi:acylneuraminate cytidylyltransferase family protein [Photobacterium sanguinicancri]|uniref:acylneuraminate cytidylyltransferase family protein n=1 Tax=Photobacterium sanguinicancri TaxID=875932 RepID=UPI0026E3AA54|nr:acylneuraminate cytidylyltransferase family protein [Photobacterium sanguinicancri]MDO6499542.1 acylneuraminate cytidylyltransferase family protein [Photobacterium sanguinicancri]
MSDQDKSRSIKNSNLTQVSSLAKVNTDKPIAIIPARGGSKRLPRKNILPLAGKPLIAWTIEAALESGVFDRVIVNTDDQEIADIAIQYGAEVPYFRPAELASDTATTMDVLKHQLQFFVSEGETYRDVVLLQPTSPLRKAQDIRNAWDLYCEHSIESVVSVTPVEHPIQWTFKADDNAKLSPLFDDALKRSQDCEQHYRLNGAIYITSSINILEHDILIHPLSNMGYKIPANRSIDIDEELDFVIAQSVLTHYSKYTD